MDRRPFRQNADEWFDRLIGDPTTKLELVHLPNQKAALKRGLSCS
jgi:hypothetical protein